MKENLKYISQDNLIKLSTALSCAGIVSITLLVLYFQSKLPPFVPFFNSMPWGEERLLHSRFIPLFPIILMVIFLLNTILSSQLYKKFTLLARVLSFNTFLFVALAFLAYLQILFLVF